MAAPSAEAGATPGQGTPGAGVQPGAPGQGGAPGQSTAAGKGDGQQGTFNWDLFPDVPEAQRELLEPHLRGVQGHVTKLETQYAPYKGLIDTVSADQVSNLIGFLKGFNQDPMATYLGMAQDMQQNGVIPAGVDLAQLQALLSGQQQAPAGQQQQEGEVPGWAQELKNQVEQQQARAQAQQEAEQQAQTDAEYQETLATSLTNIRGALNTAGIEAETVTDKMIVAAIIASDGDEQVAGQMLTGLRDSFLASFTKSNGGAPRPPNVQGQLPQPPRSQKKGDGFDDARTGAAQLLAQRNAAAAQQ